MKKNMLILLDEFFGKTTKQKFKRLIILLTMIFLFFMLTLNLECSYNEKDGFDYNWKPAADIKINKGD